MESLRSDEVTYHVLYSTAKELGGEGMNLWEKRINDSLDAATFLEGCAPRMLEAFAEMRKILRNFPRLENSVPDLAPNRFILCFCEAKCLDCHPLIPLLQMVAEHNPGSNLGILPHRENEKFLRSLLTDPTLPTLPSIFLLSDERTLEKALFGRPEEMDVVTWRTGRGWQTLFRWFPG
jgi:hypothetical protein